MGDLLKTWIAGNRRRLLQGGLLLAGLWAGVFVYNLNKPLPPGVSVTGPLRDASGMEFLYDLTYRVEGREVVQQEVFDRAFAMIGEAEEFVVLDMFLFNGLHGGERDYRPLSTELARHLLARKATRPDLNAILITDEINNFYGAYRAPHLAALEDGGVEVVLTRMGRLRDSNPAYSATWRMFMGWFGTGGPGWLPNLFGPQGPRVTLRSLLKLLNFKANHRKLLVTDRGCLVASANPHDASSFHSNIAFAGSGPICADVLAGEKAVAAFSGGRVENWPVYRGRAAGEPEGEGGPESAEAGDADIPPRSQAPGPEDPSAGSVQLVTEGKILEAFLRDVGAAGPGDEIDVAMFYVAERQVVEALLRADERGALIRLVLDPNKDAFGREKGGIPNRQVAQELVTASDGRIRVRWYDTRGEQFHTKLVLVTRGEAVTVMGGSANLTRRNITDFNLEADLRFVAPADAPVSRAATDYFDRIFENRDGGYTLPFRAYRDGGWVKRIVYRFQEFTGISSF